MMSVRRFVPSRKLVMRLFLSAVAVLLTGLVVFVGVPLFRLWLQARPIDHTMPHGDECLAEPQGENLRCWDLHVPDQVRDRPALVVDIHGFLNRPSTQRGFSDFQALADEEGFLVAWPYGIRWSWNGGGDPWPSDTELDERPGIGCCGHALNQGINDVAFIRSLIESIVASYDVDPSRIYISGFSTGCMLAQRMAAEASDVITGVACMSGFRLVEASSDYEPVPVAVFNGTDDTIAPYERDYWPGAVANFDTWRDINGCVDEPAEVWRDGDHVMWQADDCTAGSRIALITLDGVGHVTYRGHGGLDVDTTRMAWQFLEGLPPSP
ncbi:MAG: PHB depolymerase family esterase [Actinomycetota bacterium]